MNAHKKRTRIEIPPSLGTPRNSGGRGDLLSPFSFLQTLVISFSLTLASGSSVLSEKLPLRQVEINHSHNSLGIDDRLWETTKNHGDRQALLEAIEYSLDYLNTPSATKAYHDYPVPGINRDRVRRSLIRFRELLVKCRTTRELQAAVAKEFVFYQAVGKDNQGTVLFTGYFQPIYYGSRTRSQEYPYPLYAKPKDFQLWSKPHPSRIELEGEDGLLGEKSSLSGQEIVWLRDRMEAFLVQIQGSAQIELQDGTVMTLGYDGSTEYPYTSIGKELIKDGVFKVEQLSLPVLIDYFEKNPQQLDKYLSRNNRFIFFRETHGAPPIGSIGVPVTAERSIATDKSLMPPGALALIHTSLPEHQVDGKWQMSVVNRYVLDQDTGGAIIGPGRVDIFLGTGNIAGDRAGLIKNPGKLYYLLLKK